MFAVQLDSGKRLTYIPPAPMTDAEAGQAIREKFRQGGKLIKKECGKPVD
jgi:hypothetical protein